MITKEEILKGAKHCVTYDCGNCPFFYSETECEPAFAEYILANEPTSDVQEVKHGYWIPERDPDENNRIQCYHCSVCDDDFHYIGAFIATKYCPNCGTRMDGDSNDR